MAVGRATVPSQPRELPHQTALRRPRIPACAALPILFSLPGFQGLSGYRRRVIGLGVEQSHPQRRTLFDSQATNPVWLAASASSGRVG
jgi:hypothetical protein